MKNVRGIMPARGVVCVDESRRRMIWAVWVKEAAAGVPPSDMTMMVSGDGDDEAIGKGSVCMS